MQCCYGMTGPILHKTIVCAMLAHSPQTTLHRKIIFNVVWICLVNIAQGNYLCNIGPWLTDNVCEENDLYNVVSIKLGQHCIRILSIQYCLNMSETKLENIRKLLLQCWLTVHKQLCTGK